MRLGPAVRYSLHYVRTTPLRSTLTTVGILIGVATVVVFVVLSAGIQASVLDSVTGPNQNVVYVGTKAADTGGPPIVASGGAAVFTERDVERLAALSGVRATIPFGHDSVTVTHDSTTLDRRALRVTTPAYFRTLRPDAMEAGRSFRAGRREVVLNRDAAASLGGRDPVAVGDRIEVTTRDGPIDATVVGIVADAPSVSQQLVGDPPTPIVYAPADPFSTQRVDRSGAAEHQHAYAWVFVVAAEGADVRAVRDRVAAYVTERSDARGLLARGFAFSVTTYADWTAHVRELTALFAAYGIGVSVISLVVGAIGIGNIMLVSVSERIGEVGVVRAVGAQRRDVLLLFLTEAALLGVIGSVLGVGVGLCLGWVAAGYLDVPFVVSGRWLLVGVGIGVLVSTVAGAIPAWRASRLDPIEALRS